MEYRCFCGKYSGEKFAHIGLVCDKCGGMVLKRKEDGSMEIQKAIRYRVNVSQTSTGKKSWDCTVDAEGYTMDEVLAESDKIVAELTKRYPALEK